MATPSGAGSIAEVNQASSASARSRAAHRPCCPGGYARASASNRLRSAAASAIALEGVGPHLAGADPHHAIDLGDPELSVADLPRSRGLRDRVDHAVDVVVVHDDLDANLGHEVDLILRAAVHLGVPALATEPFDVARREAAHADAAQGVLDLFDPVRFHDRGDQLHRAGAYSPGPGRS